MAKDKKEQKDRREKISSPKVFNERRRSMWLIESASPTDIYLWCLCIVIMFLMLFVSLALAFAQ